VLKVLAHSCAGQTPDEMYFGSGEQVGADLAAARVRARDARLKTNRELSCHACKATLVLPPAISDSFAISSVLHLQPKHSKMS